MCNQLLGRGLLIRARSYISKLPEADLRISWTSRRAVPPRDFYLVGNQAPKKTELGRRANVDTTRAGQWEQGEAAVGGASPGPLGARGGMTSYPIDAEFRYGIAMAPWENSRVDMGSWEGGQFENGVLGRCTLACLV